MSNKLDAKDVELFLLDNLDFFESRESLLSEMKFKDSTSSASSLLERQIYKLRDEQKDLMGLLTSFIETAQLNEDLFNKSKELTLSILDASNKDEVIGAVQNDFIKSFNINNCQLNFYSNSEIDNIEKETGKNSLTLIKETLVEETDNKVKINSFDEDLRQLVEIRIKMTRQKLDNQNLQKLLKKRIEVTRSILDLNNTTQ